MNILATVEFEPLVYEWLVDFSKREEALSFSEAMNHILDLGIQVKKGELVLPDEMPVAQKMLLQSGIETWLMVKELYIKETPTQTDISVKAKELIQNTLSLKKEGP